MRIEKQQDSTRREKEGMRAEWRRAHPDKPIAVCDHVNKGERSLLLIGIDSLGMAEMCVVCAMELLQATTRFAVDVMSAGEEA